MSAPQKTTPAEAGVVIENSVYFLFIEEPKTGFIPKLIRLPPLQMKPKHQNLTGLRKLLDKI
jgi:hypothetical protein